MTLTLLHAHPQTGTVLDVMDLVFIEERQGVRRKDQTDASSGLPSGCQ